MTETSASASSELTGSPTSESRPERATWPALAKGWRRKCPDCGQGEALHSYLKVNETCTNCGLNLSQARADDGPAYLTILIVGHIMAPLLHVVYFTWRPEPLVTFSVFSIGCIVSSLYLLPRLKGVVIAYQWARRMHGFDTKS
ncbi:DUF983 domain-containing protein [Pseudophaeobacter sp.]|uniref:DUF983 domain-containing protein n=1 Tax=Pseudophaeobacter sp. TaxID=1971739 RepID=UPI003299E70D